MRLLLSSLLTWRPRLHLFPKQSRMPDLRITSADSRQGRGEETIPVKANGPDRRKRRKVTAYILFPIALGWLIASVVSFVYGERLIGAISLVAAFDCGLAAMLIWPSTRPANTPATSCEASGEDRN